jgi:hypothetical protein
MKKIKSIDMRGLSIDGVDEIIEFNINNGWKFLGYGNISYIKHYTSLCIRPKKIEYPIITFKHDEFNDYVKFKDNNNADQ